MYEVRWPHKTETRGETTDDIVLLNVFAAIRMGWEIKARNDELVLVYGSGKTPEYIYRRRAGP